MCVCLFLFIQLRDVRRELQDVLHERDVAVAKSARVDDLEETVSELRRHNKELEDQARRSRGVKHTYLFAAQQETTIETTCVLRNGLEIFLQNAFQFGKV